VDGKKNIIYVDTVDTRRRETAKTKNVWGEEEEKYDETTIEVGGL
jgi:hypothetical protein